MVAASHLVERSGIQWQKPKTTPRMGQESSPRLTTACPAVLKMKWLKWFRASSFFHRENKGSCVWMKQLRKVEAVIAQCINGRGPSFVAANFRLHSVGSVQLSLTLSHLSPPASHIRAALYHSAPRPMWGLLPGQSHMAWHLGNARLRLSSRSCYQPSPDLFHVTDSFFSSNTFVQDYLKSSGVPPSQTYYFWGLKINNILIHFSLFRQKEVCIQKIFWICSHFKLTRTEKFRSLDLSGMWEFSAKYEKKQTTSKVMLRLKPVQFRVEWNSCVNIKKNS